MQKIQQIVQNTVPEAFYGHFLFGRLHKIPYLCRIKEDKYLRVCLSGVVTGSREAYPEGKRNRFTGHKTIICYKKTGMLCSIYRF